MEESAEPKPPKPPKNAPTALVVMAAIVIGAASGILIADRNSGSALKGNVTGQLARIPNNQTASVHPAETKPKIPAPENPPASKPQAENPSKVIPIGLSSLDAIRYSVQSGSIHMDFDLESTKLVGTGVLAGPDRIYIDLQESRRVQGEVGRLKTVSVDGDPVARVRIAEREAGAVRIVLDLSRSCDFKYQILPGSPSRLVLEIRPRAAGTSLSM